MRKTIHTEHREAYAPVPKSEIDLNAYENVSEIYRELMAPTSVSLASVPGTGEKVFIKKIFKDCLVNDLQQMQAVQEFPLHCSLDHENIVKGAQWSETNREFILITEFMNKADYLKEKIETRLSPIKNEEKLRSYIRDILKGLFYLHSKGIVHGDIKLEHLLLHKYEDRRVPTVKICDFGLSRVLVRSTGKFLMTVPAGSASYMAPEITSGAYVNEKIDMWSLGVVLYKMCVAYRPTQVSGYRYGTGPIPFRRVDWRNKSKEIQDLIVKLLEPDAEKRISAKEALEHPWFKM